MTEELKILFEEAWESQNAFNQRSTIQWIWRITPPIPVEWDKFNCLVTIYAYARGIYAVAQGRRIQWSGVD